MEALSAAVTELGADAHLTALTDLGPADVLVIDAYSIRAERPTFEARVLAAVDDLERDLAADLVVDPNPGGASTTTAAGQLLHGIDYALIGPIPLDLEVRSLGERTEQVLVTTGGSDEGGIGAGIAARLHQELPDAEVRLVVGPWSNRQVPSGITSVEQPDGLWHELAAADLIVTAGGVTMLEACASGRPTVAITLADNQRRAVEGAARAGAVVGIEPGAALDEIAQTVGALARDVGRRQNLAAASVVWVDARGPQRVAEALLALA